jgi:hypothetical protein
MKSFKHSGTSGDLIYSLPIMKHFGGGEFYLHLNQIDWIGMNYYGSKPDPFHQGRMTLKDFEFLAPLLEAQPYITAVATLDPRTTAITHNLDKFRPVFVGHPGNYVDCYCEAFDIRDEGTRTLIRTTPWLTVPQPIPTKKYVINRTARWLPPTLNPVWAEWKDGGADKESVFVGLPEEHKAFEEATGWKLDYVPTANMLELASVIAACDQFIGNQSVALSIAIGLGVDYACEARTDLPLDRNECYFPDQPNGEYF